MTPEHYSYEELSKDATTALGLTAKVRDLLQKFTAPMLMSGSLLILPSTTSANSGDLSPKGHMSDQIKVNQLDDAEKAVPAADYKNHCHMVSTFEGMLKDGKLVQSNFKGKAYAATDKGMLGICFYFPGDNGEHPPHYQFNVVGPAKIYETGEHQLKPKNVMQCRDAGPCK